MSVFGVSELGSDIIVAEDEFVWASIRGCFVVLSFICGSIGIWKITKIWSSVPYKHKIHMKGIQQVYILLLLNIIGHTWHYADNIARPVPYHEPKWLYVKRILSQMEITFSTQWILVFFAINGFYNIIHFPKNDKQFTKGLLNIIVGYCCISLITFGHYFVDFPSSYSWDVNFSIMFEGFSSIILLIYTMRLYSLK